MPGLIQTADRPGEPARITPEQALILYRAPNRDNGPSRLVLDHAVHSVDGQVVIGAGKVLSDASLTRLVSLLQDGQEPVDWFLPANVLIASQQRLVWWVKGRVRPMHFSIGGRHQKLQVAWPSLLFSVREGRLRVAALRGSRRPMPGSRVFHAPLMNIGRLGDVCLGSAKAPDAWTVDQRDAWEAIIFDTNFSHTNHDRTLQTGKRARPVSDTTHLRFWRKLHREQTTRFPTEALVSVGKTLRHWL